MVSTAILSHTHNRPALFAQIVQCRTQIWRAKLVYLKSETFILPLRDVVSRATTGQ